jgi:hypothetical protein
MINFYKLKFVAVFTILLSACSTPVEQVEISTVPVERPRLVLPPPGELNMRDVEWIVVTKDNIDQIMQNFNETGERFVLFALTVDGYENLSLNTNDLRSFIEQQQAIIVAYKNYYK